MSNELHPADQAAYERIIAVRPAWTAMRSAKEAVGLEAHTLLHCGPPAPDGESLVQPTLNSAAVACVFEGWADSLQAGMAMVLAGEIRLQPAQDRRVATPMAAVVSPSMQLIEMTDLDGKAAPAYAPINGGGSGASPAPRYGRCAPECVEFQHFLNGDVASLMAEACREPVPWLPIIDHGLQNGDDCHLRHQSSHQRLVETMRSRIGSSGSAADQFIGEWPFYHLNFWMAGIRCILSTIEGMPNCSVICAFGGNGKQFGLQVAAFPGRWFTIPATPPLGKLRPPHRPETTVGAYGDSAVVEAFGLGAMAHSFAPDMQALHAGFTPDDILDLPSKLLCGPHPALADSGALVALSARAVVKAGVSPVVELGIVDKQGEDGGLGAGIYRPSVALFEAACAALQT
jgi:hypothetical protein